MIDTSCGARALHGEKKEEQAVRFLDRVRNALMRFMYGRYGHDQLNRALCVLILALYLISLIAVFVPILKSRDQDNRFLMLKICVLGTALMMLLEDIDGSNWSICLFYLLLAFLRNPRWEGKKEL